MVWQTSFVVPIRRGRMLHNSLKILGLSADSAIAAICLENRDLRNEATIYTALEQVSLRLYRPSESRESSANDNFPMST
jgi:hypothetical protein